MSSPSYWNDELVIGLPFMDRGHESICVSFSTLHAAMEEKDPDLSFILTKLIQIERDISQHYKVEETLMESLTRPGSIEHITHHKELHRQSLDILEYVRDLLERGASLKTCEIAFTKFTAFFFKEVIEYDYELYGFLIKEGLVKV